MRQFPLLALVALLTIAAVSTHGCGHSGEGGSSVATDQTSPIRIGQPTVVPAPRVAADRPEVQTSPQLAPVKSDASVKRVRLSEEGYRPKGLYGELSVGIGLDRQVHMVNVVTGERWRLTGGLDRKREAVISNSHIAWTSQNWFREVLSNAPLVRPSYHIFVMDIETGVTRRITSGTAMRRYLRIDGFRLVWEESRSMAGDRYTDYDIYAYDMALDEKIPVAVAPGSQRRPAIHGDRVIWIDDRECPETQKTGVSTRSCPGDLLDIYLYDFATGEERLVAKSAASGYHAPDIHGEYVVWRRHEGRYYEQNSIHLYSLHDGREREVASLDLGSMGNPLVSDEYVAWTVREACDVIWIPPRDMGTGAFVYSIKNGTTQQLTDFPAPDVLLDGRTAVIHESCWLPGPVYSIFLD